MTRRDIAPLFFPGFFNTLVKGSGSTPSDNSENHTAWVASVLKQMNSVKPGSTHDDLLKLFSPEGGLVVEGRGTFVSRDCPYFKIDVEWSKTGSSGNEHSQVTQSVITKMTKPYLQFSTLD